MCSGRLLGHDDDPRLHFVVRGEIAHRRHLLAVGGLRRRIHGVDAEVLVSAVILRIEDVLPVLAPEILEYGAVSLVRYRPRVIPGLVGPADPDVEDPVQRLDDRHVLAVRRQPAEGQLGIAEKDLAVHEGRQVVQVAHTAGPAPRRRRSPPA